MMIRHIVGLNYKKEFSEEENRAHAVKIKEEIEQLKSIIPQIQHIEFIINPLETTTFDLILVAEFHSMEDLQTYVVHEAHEKAAAYIVSVLTEIQCIDYEY